MDSAGPKHLQMSLTRAKFEQIVEPIIDRVRQPCVDALRDAGLKPAEIDDVVLVGGSTRIPLVQAIVKEVFGKDPSKGVNPDEVVAVGAARTVVTPKKKNKQDTLLMILNMIVSRFHWWRFSLSHN